MRRGCIVISAFKCDECGAVMEHGQRYLLISDDDENSKKTRICTSCAENKGMASYITEKGEQVLTFFGDEAKQKESKSRAKEARAKETKAKEAVVKEPKAKTESKVKETKAKESGKKATAIKEEKKKVTKTKPKEKPKAKSKKNK
jgi:hypothetical protein